MLYTNFHILMKSKTEDLGMVRKVEHRFVDRKAHMVYAIVSFFKNVTVALLECRQFTTFLYFLNFQIFSIFSK